MNIIKRNSLVVPFDPEKIRIRVQQQCTGLDAKFVDPDIVANKVCSGLYDNITTAEIDTLAAEIAAGHAAEHPDYGILAARIEASRLHKYTHDSIADVARQLRGHIDAATLCHAPLITEEVAHTMINYAIELNAAIDYTRDFAFDYFGLRTLMKSYLLQINGKIVERPQHLFMRVAVSLHLDNIAMAINTYELMSTGMYTHASPTLFNAGTPCGQLSSCFLLNAIDDSIDGIFDTVHRCATISKGAGGIGLAIHKIRAKGSAINGTGGTSNGLVPMLRVFNETARYVDQGGGKRKGAIAIYIEPWHADIFDVLELRKNHGKEEMRARDLFYALWTPDLFMQRVKDDGMWSLMCPRECPGLNTTYGAEFEVLYTKYETAGKFRKQIRAQELWRAIVNAQLETGNPYMLYKDACNTKSNQKNLGTIECSNLCTEIVQYSSPDETAVCNLASIALPKFVGPTQQDFDYDQLHVVTRAVTRNLNAVIDVTKYPTPESRASNLSHRPIGLGVQGLADVFAMLGMPFESERARSMNKRIFETIYHAALTESCALAREHGAYQSYPESPAARGILQFDMWGENVDSSRIGVFKIYDWPSLRRDIATYGLRNSLLVAPMPTASTSQILGNTECIEPFNSNIYVRRTNAGEFQVVNRHLVRALTRIGLWSNHMKQLIIAHNGSVANIECIPSHIREVFKTVWEIKAKTIVDYAADRGVFIDQSQSLNLHMTGPSYPKLTSYHFYAWSKGLKTGMYYLRSKAASDAIKFTIDPSISAAAATAVVADAGQTCAYGAGEEGCTSCSA